MAKQEKDSEGDMTFYLPRVDGLNTVKHMCKRTLIFTFSIKTHCCISEHRSAVVLHLIMLPLCGQTKKHNEVWKKKNQACTHDCALCGYANALQTEINVKKLSL